MMTIHKETRVIAKEIEGSDFLGDPVVQTSYNFDLKLDEIVNKPAFMVNTISQILFPSNDRIIFGCFEAFFFDNPENVPTVDQLWNFVYEASETITQNLRSETNIYSISLQPPDKGVILPLLKQIMLGGFRLN
jgi:hypothetical protein